jgi:hypothetical protein
MRLVFSSSPRLSNRRAKVQAAFIGPTVWELEGPMPILNRSNTLTAIKCSVPYYVTIKRDEKELAVRRVLQGMALADFSNMRASLPE